MCQGRVSKVAITKSGMVSVNNGKDGEKVFRLKNNNMVYKGKYEQARDTGMTLNNCIWLEHTASVENE